MMAHQLGHRCPDWNEFLCECANADCTFTSSRSPLRAYEAVRADPKQFVVLPAPLHAGEVEELVAEKPAYWIVRGKQGEAGDYVEKLNPRGRLRTA